MATKTVSIQTCALTENNAIRSACRAYGGAESTMFAAWDVFFTGLDAIASGVKYKLLLTEVRTIEGILTEKKDLPATARKEYQSVRTAHSRYQAYLKGASEKGATRSWAQVMNEGATRAITRLQGMAAERIGARDVPRLIAAWQVVQSLTK